MDMLNPQTLDQAKEVAKKMAQYAKDSGAPCAFEVVQTKRKPFEVQVFGTHALIKSHKLLHVEPIPK